MPSLVETVARAMSEAAGENPDEPTWTRYDRNVPEWELWHYEAKAAIRAVLRAQISAPWPVQPHPRDIMDFARENGIDLDG